MCFSMFLHTLNFRSILENENSILILVALWTAFVSILILWQPNVQSRYFNNFGLWTTVLEINLSNTTGSLFNLRILIFFHDHIWNMQRFQCEMPMKHQRWVPLSDLHRCKSETNKQLSEVVLLLNCRGQPLFCYVSIAFPVLLICKESHVVCRPFEVFPTWAFKWIMLVLPKKIK